MVTVLDSIDSVMPLSMCFSYMWFGTWEAFGPSSSVAGIIYNYEFCFIILVVALEVLCAWVGRSSDEYLVISICGLNKFDHFRMGARCM